MCIAVYKPQNVAFPTKSEFKTMFRNNPDGAGFMYSDGKNVIIHKGFMSFNSFWNTFRNYRKMTDTAFVFHFRITTHGGTSCAMTQPFPFTDRTRELRKLYTKTQLGVAHNGMIPLTYEAHKISDTALFIKKYLTRIINNPYKIDALDEDIISACIDSKMILLHPNGTANLIGDFVKSGGRYYSNYSFVDYDERPLHKTNTSYSESFHTDSWYDAFDNNDWWECGYNSEAEYIADLKNYNLL